ncbi:MAG: hypothetical protein ABI824_12965 [Acidobacteriota bacterium]
MSSPSEALSQLLAVLDRMEVAYSIGGSVASSHHGTPRSTLDVDLVADLAADQVDELALALQGGFYADAQTMRDAIRLGRSFNVIHLQTAYKFDFFPLKSDAYSKTEFARRRFLTISFGEPVECALASAEDTILRKLLWYRSGGQTSERQWNDVRGVLRQNRDRLDYDYMQHWSKELKIDDLLSELLAEPEP